MISKLIECVYDSTCPLPTNLNFYENVIEDIDYYGTSSQIYYLLKKTGLFKKTPLFFQERLTKKYNDTVYTNVFIKVQTEKIFSLFEKKEIEIIPLKGVFFSERYFGHIGARGTSDIDILVRPTEVKQAIEYVKQLGFIQEEDPIPSHFHRSFSKEIVGSPIPLVVEIHWDIVKAQTSNMNIDEFWSNAAKYKAYNYVRQLSDYHSFYMICLHGWRHNLDSPKYYLDIIQMIYELKEKIDYSTLLKDAKRHQTHKRIVRTLSIVYQNYPFLERVIPFSQIQSKKHFYMSPKGYKKYIDFIDYQFLSYDSSSHSFKEFREWLLTSRRQIHKLKS
ncbi:nucleotidyltransferase family protein [Cytobacillus suaedae]|nr:nucleotidyltransferase family protein [Cytobacillus suaedae]